MTDNTYAVTADELRQIVERVEQLISEKKDIMEQITEVFSDAKGRGFDVKALKEILKLRAKDPDDIAEEETILDVYKTALGMI